MNLQESLYPLIRLALAEDFGEIGDVTSLATIPEERIVTGKITAKSGGVIAGIDVVSWVYEQVDPDIVINPLVPDGESVEPGTVICIVEGKARSVMAGERTALNFLQRLSGVATLTRQYVDAIAGTRATVLDTRKTTPGWRIAQKYAVRMGGGSNHRMGLFDMILIKDNHIDAAGSITAAVEAARANPLAEGIEIEVEVKDEDELREALALNVDRILLDNMTPQQMGSAVQITGGSIPLEASGNITLETIRAVAETGVDYISVGALTHSAPILDLSMRLQTETIAVRSS